MVASFVRELNRERGAAAVARGNVRDLFRGLDSTHRVHILASDAELVVSELVTNAVVHGAGIITLRVQVIDGSVSVGVQDSGGGMPHIDGVEPSAEGGRGLAVVAGLVSEWGVRSDGNGGKEVWALLRTEPALDLTSRPPTLA